MSRLPMRPIKNGCTAYIHTRMPGPVKVAVCETCGWESNLHATAIGAIMEREQHIDRRSSSQRLHQSPKEE